MIGESRIAVIIPALNEAATIGRVIEAIPPWVDRVIVADNASEDETSSIARQAGAEVVWEGRRGYGGACLAGMNELTAVGGVAAQGDRVAPDAVVFLDGDFSDNPAEMRRLVEPIIDGDHDLVIGSRVKGECEPGALTTTQRFGNWLSCMLMRAFFGVEYSDLGPFRALKWGSLCDLEMDDRAFGWTVQMQVRAARRKMRIIEVPVSYRNRAGGESKVSGTIRGVIGAGTTILYVIFREALDEAVDRCVRRQTSTKSSTRTSY